MDALLGMAGWIVCERLDLCLQLLRTPTPKPEARPSMALAGVGTGVHAARETCGQPVPRKRRNTIPSLYSGLSWAQACLRLPFRAGPV